MLICCYSSNSTSTPPHEFSHTASCHFKGAFKWPKFSLIISAQRYYTETPHEFNVLTSFLKRIWVQLSESFSELKIGWFLWHLDQKIILTLTVNFYCTRIGGQFDTCITSVFNVTHGPIQLAKSATVCFTSNLAGIFIGSFSSCSPQVNNLPKNWKLPSFQRFFLKIVKIRPSINFYAKFWLINRPGKKFSL